MGTSNVKILGIGLPKTGTSSLNEALRILKFKTYHSPRSMKARYYRSQFNFKEDWDAITNLFEHSFPAIDEVYPGTKFICTCRDVDSWLVSVKRTFDYLDKSQNTTNKILPERLVSLQCSRYNEPILRYVHRFHKLAVEDYFCNREDDILFLNVVEGEGWEKLCEFLNVKVPRWNFPHLNKKDRYKRG